MKKFVYISLVMTISLLLSSCGINTATILNHNQSSTQVQLSANNFKVIDKVSGSAEVDYICMIGAMNRKQLYADAYNTMLEKANLVGSSKALINIITEEHIGGVPFFYYKRTVTVSANVVEFSK